MLLVEGNTSTQVKYLQHGLRMLCFNPKRLDGVFDTNTTLVVKRYQTSRGLTSDGKVGDGTWHKLKSDIIPLQTSLKNKGYYSGTIDGVAGDTLRPTSLSSDELEKLKQLLDTEESHQAQDNLKRSDVNGYIEHGKELGITDEKALIYFSDCYNQSPSGIFRIGEKAGNQWSSMTLDSLHSYALNDIYEKMERNMV